MFRFLFLLCSVCAKLQLCSADNHEKQIKQTIMHCIKTCSSFPENFFRIQPNAKMLSQQSCYDECLRNLGHKYSIKNHAYQLKRLFKKFKRDVSVNPGVSKESNVTKQESCKVNPASCEEDARRHVNAIPNKHITITFQKLRDTDRFYANVSWIPPHESANITGFKLIYIMGRYWDFCCRNLDKTITSAIVDGFSKGLKANEYFRAKVLTLPLTPTGGFVDVTRKKVQLTRTPTDPGNQETTSPAKSEGGSVGPTKKSTGYDMEE